MKNALIILAFFGAFQASAQHMNAGQHEATRILTSLHTKWSTLGKIVRANSELLKDCADGKTGLFDTSCETAFKGQNTLSIRDLKKEVDALAQLIESKNSLFDSQSKAKLNNVTDQFGRLFSDLLWAREEILKARQSQNYSSVVADGIQIKYKTAIELTASLPFDP